MRRLTLALVIIASACAFVLPGIALADESLAPGGQNDVLSAASGTSESVGVLEGESHAPDDSNGTVSESQAGELPSDDGALDENVQGGNGAADDNSVIENDPSDIGEGDPEANPNPESTPERSEPESIPEPDATPSAPLTEDADDAVVPEGSPEAGGESGVSKPVAPSATVAEPTLPARDSSPSKTNETAAVHAQSVKAEGKTQLARASAAVAKQSTSTKSADTGSKQAFANANEYVLAPKHVAGMAMHAKGSSLSIEKLDRTYHQMWKCVYTDDGFAQLLTSQGLALGVEGGKARAGAGVVLSNKSNAKAQRWTIVKDGAGYKIVSALSTKALELVLGVRDAADSAGSLLEVNRDQKTTSQRWGASNVTALRAALDQQAKDSKMPTGSYAIASALGKALALTDSDSNATSSTYNGAQSQGWTVQIAEDGWATIIAPNGKALDVRGASAEKGSNIWLYKANGSRAQKWLLDKNDKGAYVLRSALWPNMVVDIEAASQNSGTNVRLWSANGTKAQAWDLRALAPKAQASAKLAAGWYAVKLAYNSKLSLDVKSACWKSGTAFQLFSGNGSIAQRFRLIAVGKYYRIEAGTNAGSYLAFAGGKVVPGTKAVVNNSANRNTFFSLIKGKKGYKLLNIASGLYLGVDRSRAKGTQLTGRDDVLGGVCEFKLTKIPGLVDEGAYAVRTVLSGKRGLSVVGASWSNGAGMELSSYKKQLDQKWWFAPVKDRPGVYTIENMGSGLKLTGARKARATQSSKNGALQQWEIVASKGAFILKNRSTGMMLEPYKGQGNEATRVVNWTANGKDAQRWSIAKVPVLDDGLYQILSAANTKLALDLTGSSSADGADIAIRTKGAGVNQKWTITVSKGRIVSLSSGKAVDVAKAQTKSGTNVQQYRANGTKAQKWTVSYAGAGRYVFKSGLGYNLVLGVSSTKAGTSVKSYKNQAGNALRQWRLVNTTAPKPKVYAAEIRNGLKGISMKGVKGVGIDVSFWNGNINWKAVKNAGIDFAIIRIGYGNRIEDEQIANYIRGCRANGIPYGLYYYSTATNASQATAEANHALGIMKRAGVTPSTTKYAVYYDLEESNMGSTSKRKVLADMTKAFNEKMKAAGYKTGVYANLNWWNNYLTDASFKNYERWIAQWNTSCWYTGTYKLWQYTSDGSVPGISGRVDMNLMY